MPQVCSQTPLALGGWRQADSGRLVSWVTANMHEPSLSVYKQPLGGQWPTHDQWDSIKSQSSVRVEAFWILIQHPHWTAHCLAWGNMPIQVIRYIGAMQWYFCFSKCLRVTIDFNHILCTRFNGIIYKALKVAQELDELAREISVRGWGEGLHSEVCSISILACSCCCCQFLEYFVLDLETDQQNPL